MVIYYVNKTWHKDVSQKTASYSRHVDIFCQISHTRTYQSIAMVNVITRSWSDGKSPPSYGQDKSQFDGWLSSHYAPVNVDSYVPVAEVSHLCQTSTLSVTVDGNLLTLSTNDCGKHLSTPPYQWLYEISAHASLPMTIGDICQPLPTNDYMRHISPLPTNDYRWHLSTLHTNNYRRHLSTPPYQWLYETSVNHSLPMTIWDICPRLPTNDYKIHMSTFASNWDGWWYILSIKLQSCNNVFPTSSSSLRKLSRGEKHPERSIILGRMPTTNCIEITMIHSANNTD